MPQLGRNNALLLAGLLQSAAPKGPGFGQQQQGGGFGDIIALLLRDQLSQKQNERFLDRQIQSQEAIAQRESARQQAIDERTLAGAERTAGIEEVKAARAKEVADRDRLFSLGQEFTDPNVPGEGVPQGKANVIGLANAGDPQARAVRESFSLPATIDESRTVRDEGGRAVAQASVGQRPPPLPPPFRSDRQKAFDTEAGKQDAQALFPDPVDEGKDSDVEGVFGFVDTADKIATEIEGKWATPGGPPGTGVPTVRINLPGFLNFTQSEDIQSYRDAINTIVAIGVDEFVTGNPTESDIARIRALFMPSPGDEPGTIARKIERRGQMTRALELKMGGSGIEDLSDEDLDMLIEVQQQVEVQRQAQEGQ